MQTPGLCWTVRFHVVGVDAKRETETERGNQTEMQRETGSQRQEPVGLQACTGCDADQNEGVSEGWEGAGTGGSLQGLNTRSPEGHFEDTHISGQREEMCRVVALLYGRTADLGVASP